MQVIFETSRLASVVNGVLRKTTTNLEMNGIVLQNHHLNSSFLTSKNSMIGIEQ